MLLMPSVSQRSIVKAVILAGGFGTRLSEETHLRPKPMVEIGGKPILWHIMKFYSHYGINDFIICCGYKGYVIKEYFANYYLHSSDITFHMDLNHMEVHRRSSEPWKVTLIDTGETTGTGGRLRKVREFLNETFCFTYGDGLSDINIDELISFHRQHGLLATVSGVQPPGRYGSLKIDGDLVTSFVEKPQGDGGWINGGFFVLQPDVLDLIESDDCNWEESPLTTLSNTCQLALYKHHGFWQSMDTLQNRQKLELLWSSCTSPWKIWS